MLDKKSQIVILFFRGGYIIDKASLYSEAKSIDIKHDIGKLICQFYSKKTSIPKKIILSDDFHYAENLKKELTDFTLYKKKVDVQIKKSYNQLLKLANEKEEGKEVKNNKEKEESI